MPKQLELFTTDEEIDVVSKFEDKYEINFKSGTVIRISKQDFNKMMGAYFSETLSVVQSNTTRGSLKSDAVTAGVWNNSMDGNNIRMPPAPAYNPADVAFSPYVPLMQPAQQVQEQPMQASSNAIRYIMPVYSGTVATQGTVSFNNIPAEPVTP